jgi:hypothetical protein
LKLKFRLFSVIRLAQSRTVTGVETEISAVSVIHLVQSRTVTGVEIEIAPVFG